MRSNKRDDGPGLVARRGAGVGGRGTVGAGPGAGGSRARVGEKTKRMGKKKWLERLFSRCGGATRYDAGLDASGEMGNGRRVEGVLGADECGGPGHVVRSSEGLSTTMGLPGDIDRGEIGGEMLNSMSGSSSRAADSGARVCIAVGAQPTLSSRVYSYAESLTSNGACSPWGALGSTGLGMKNELA